MKLFAQAIDLKDDPSRVAEYIRHHRAVWPEVTDGLRAIGIRGMRIFLGGTRLFMIIETDDGFDPARDYQAYANDPKTREWDEFMRSFQQPAPFARPGEWWTSLEEIFDIDWFPSGRTRGHS
ncbi:MAG: L-rhamnose mutarotase [Phycisphaerales bacterium]|jgi:L-rhamnose mutarotase